MGDDDREKKSWRDIDRGRDVSAHRRDEHRGPGKGPRVDSATAAYKRKLNAFFDRGVVPEHLKGKLPDGESEGASPRQQLMRAIRDADSQRKLEKAVDELVDQFGLPDDDMELMLRVLEHSKDSVLLDALAKVEAFVETGMPMPRKARMVSRLRNVEAASFDPRVQAKAGRLAGQLR
ncbi:MAG: hypothetical protein KC613_21095 [Myxococcales bacterium]|nr:hypothetical protein [Myxococcales bacterium]MCB9521963.1 hypothetical protein [Myxococcales bacterium]